MLVEESFPDETVMARDVASSGISKGCSVFVK